MLRASFPVVFAALCTFGATSAAQSQSGKVFARYNKPLKSVSLDLSTGTITRGPVVHDRGTPGTTIDFNNNDLGGFVGVDTGGGFCEWFDAGVKGFAGNGSDLMNNFVFAYCSAMLTPGSGGPGGSVNLGFYEGYALFGGVPTTAVAVFTLTGLPGNTGSSSFFGGFACYFINVTFANLVAFADGPIGYSWGFLDTGTDGTLAGTWPFLSCVVSCSGAILQVDGQGMTDAIDQYCPPGTLRATFTFGTTSGSFTSVSMDIREATDATCADNNFNAVSTPNPDLITTDWVGPVRGHLLNRPFTWLLFRGVSSAPSSWIVNVRTARIPLPNGVQGPSPLPIGAGGRILISGPQLGAFSGTHNGAVGVTPSGTIAGAIPASLGLLGAYFTAQATVLGAGVRVSSAIEGTIGAGPF